MKHSFRNDYNVLAHPRILEALSRCQNEIFDAYGLDIHSEKAAKYIKNVFGSNNAEVFFLTGGTQTNMVFISYCLRNYEGVIACDTGHINVHETASIEGSGHKIITVENVNGKLSAQDILNVLDKFNDEHMVKPRMVYISNSTETGSIYSFEELKAIHEVCQKRNLYLFIDGARLGVALTSKENDIEPRMFGGLCDAFYVGGTKNGLLYGEALVINNKELAKDFRYHIKNKGAMLAKGFVVGLQFEEIFKDGLYFELAKKSNENAKKLKDILTKHHINILPSPTNQIFAECEKEAGYALLNEFMLEKWEEKENTLIVRFVTSFFTNEDDLNAVEDFLNR